MSNLTPEEIEGTYPEIINEVMQHIELVKRGGSRDSLLDIIMDYCLKNSLDVNLIGDAIHSDTYLKDFIEKDCEQNRIFKGKLAEEW